MRDTFLTDIVFAESKRQEENMELIASENFASIDTLSLMSTCLNNKYAEGYPNGDSVEKFKKLYSDYIHTGKVGRYYGGCENVDMIELYCRYKWQQVFNVVGEYHVNVQPHSGTQANMEAYDAVLAPGDTILAMSLADGGHLSHSAPVSFVGKKYNVITYGVTEDNELDYEDICAKIYLYHPKLIVTGASAFSGRINFARIKAMINEYEANSFSKIYLLADISHVAGLVANGFYDNPFFIADIITTTTHKTLRGPRGALIFCKPELAEAVDASVFPRNQGGPLMHVIAAKAQAATECLSLDYYSYIKNVVDSAAAMCDAFIERGAKVVGNGTSNHLFILDTMTSFGLTGLQAQNILEEKGYTVNKNAIPNDPLPPSKSSGIRIGTPAIVSLGAEPMTARVIAINIYNVLKGASVSEQNI